MYDNQLTKKTKYIANSPESKHQTKNKSISPGSFTQSTILQLQHTIGNKATAQLLLDTGAVRILHPVQREAKHGLMQMMPAAGVVQCQEGEEEEELQMKPLGSAIQRQEGEEEELQMMPASGVVQRQEGEEEQDLQMMPSQRTEIPGEEENLQMKRVSIFQRKEIEIPVKRIPKSFNNTFNALAVHPKINRPSQFQPPIQKKNDQIPEHRENNTGMPDNLKSGLEALSGLSLSDLHVHRNSDKPPQVGALAYTLGTDIHVAPGQEQHLPHEGWHAVQQKQGRVQATTQAAGLPVNDEPVLEKEADVMGAKAAQLERASSYILQRKATVIQMVRAVGETPTDSNVVITLTIHMTDHGHSKEEILQAIIAGWGARRTDHGRTYVPWGEGAPVGVIFWDNGDSFSIVHAQSGENKRIQAGIKEEENRKLREKGGGSESKDWRKKE